MPPARTISHTLSLCTVAAWLAPCAGAQEPIRPGQLQRVTVYTESGVTSYALTNGVHVHLRPSARTSKVFVAVFVPGVEVDETEATRAQTLLGRQTLSLPSTSGRLSVHHKEEGLSFALETTPQQLRADLRELAAMLAKPVMAEPSFDHAKDLLSQVARMNLPPDHVAAGVRALIGAAVHEPDARFFPPTEPQISAVTFEAASTRISRVLAARAIDVAICGDVDSPEAETDAVGVFASLPPRPRDRLERWRYTTPGQGPSEVTITGPSPAFTLVVRAPPISDLRRVHLASLAGDHVKEHLPGMLRDAGSPASQTLVVAVAPGRLFPAGGLGLCTWIDSVPADAAKAAQSARSAMAQISARGSDQEIRRRIDRLADSVQDERMSAQWWASALSSAWFLGCSIEQMASEPRLIRSLTPDDVRTHTAQTWADGIVRTIVVSPAP